MAAPGLSHAQLAAKLAVDGVLPILDGKPRRDQIPVPALPLEREEKAKLGLPADSLAVFYPLGDTGVFLSMKGSSARVWYFGVNTDGALETFERALRDAYPKTSTFHSQTEHPDVSGMSVRLYHVDFTPEIMAELEVTYPTTLGVKQQFIIRVHAQRRVDRH